LREGSVDITQALAQDLPLTTKVRDRNHFSRCGICGRVALGQDFAPVTSAFPCHSHSKSAPVSRFVHTYNGVSGEIVIILVGGSTDYPEQISSYKHVSNFQWVSRYSCLNVTHKKPYKSMKERQMIY